MGHEARRREERQGGEQPLTWRDRHTSLLLPLLPLLLLLFLHLLFFLLVVLGFELGALCLIGNCCTI
jgi:hypothetical protein